MSKEIQAFIVNAKAYDDGNRDMGEWVSFPITNEEMKAVYERIGIDGKDFKEIFLDDFKTDIAGLRNVLSVHTDIDELNYLAFRLSEISSYELAKLDTVAEVKPYTDLKTFIDFAPNMDYYVLIEGVKNAEDMGNYCIDKSGMIDMPDEWKRCIDPKALGELILKDEKGKFTEKGYLIKSGDLWCEVYDNKDDIPKNYRISPQEVFKQSVERLSELEQHFLKSPTDAYAIYQLKDNEELRYHRFEGLESLKTHHLSVERENYNLVYKEQFTGFSSVRDRLEELWECFNLDHPDDFKGHSLSVSDIIAIKHNGIVTYHYCDSYDFVELPNFKEPAPLIPDNPLRTAEISTEQNFNQIDGILNNQPTAGEKEKRTSIVKQLKTQPVISKEKQKTAPNGAEMER